MFESGSHHTSFRVVPCTQLLIRNTLSPISICRIGNVPTAHRPIMKATSIVRHLSIVCNVQRHHHISFWNHCMLPSSEIGFTLASTIVTRGNAIYRRFMRNPVKSAKDGAKCYLEMFKYRTLCRETPSWALRPLFSAGDRLLSCSGPPDLESQNIALSRTPSSRSRG